MWYILEQINYPKTRADIISRARENGFSVADNDPICVYRDYKTGKPTDLIFIKTAKEVIEMNDYFVLNGDLRDWPDELDIKDFTMWGNPRTKTKTKF